MTTEKHEDLKKIGANAMASIREMVAALQCDYDRLQELRDERDSNDEHDDQCGQSGIWAQDHPDDAQELADLEAAAGECESREDAETRIQEDALSVEFRSGWTTDRQEISWDECQILLTTGGPAVRIMVELEDGEAHRAYLQVQDWGTPWTDYYEEGIGETLLAYCGVFYFGE